MAHFEIGEYKFQKTYSRQSVALTLTVDDNCRAEAPEVCNWHQTTYVLSVTEIDTPELKP